MDKKRSIVFINQSSGYLMIDIVNAFAGKYEKRALITGALFPRNKTLDKNAKIHKIIAYSRNTKIKRVFTWFTGFIQVFFIVFFKYRNSYLFIVTNPPFVTFIPLFTQNNFSVLVFDVYPDTLVKSKLLSENSILVNWWAKLNKKVYLKASRVFTITESMKTVLSAYCDKNKIEVVSLWTDTEFLKPIDKDENIFIKEHNLNDKFIVMYSGNLGYTHNIELILELAENSENKNIYFMLIGEGDKKEQLNTNIQAKQLVNIAILPRQDVQMFPHSFAAAHLALITLNKESASLSIPSKTYDFLAAGVPLLCICDNHSALNDLVLQNNVGKCFNEDKLDEMLNFITVLSENKSIHNELEKNARSTAFKFNSANAQNFL